MTWSPINIAISGNIGAGKSCLLTNLGKMGYKVLHENYINWGQLFLDALIDPYRWSFSSQLNIMVTQAKLKEIARCTMSNTEPLIIERTNQCILDFTKMNNNLGFISDDEMVLATNINNILPNDIDFCIYLNTPPEICLQRIALRGRLFEQNITLTYLTELDKMFKKNADMYIDGSVNALQVTQQVITCFENKKIYPQLK